MLTNLEILKYIKYLRLQMVKFPGEEGRFIVAILHLYNCLEDNIIKDFNNLDKKELFYGDSVSFNYEKSKNAA